MQQDLPHRNDRAGASTEDRNAVMARSRSKEKIERDTEARGDKAHALQNAERTGQIPEPELIDERKHEHRIDGDQAERVQELGLVGRHARTYSKL